MGNLKAFLTIPRQEAGYRSVHDRVNDYSEVEQTLNAGERKLQASRCMDCGVPFCHWACPLGNRSPEFQDALYKGKWKEAYQILVRTNDFPEFTGRICPALCEKSCVLKLSMEAPVTIRENEKAIIEAAFREGYISPCNYQRNGKKVAVIGSGPAGLSTAYFLNKRGHSVTVFERFDRIGGLLMYGIPNMKLEKRFIERRIKIMEEEGVVFKTNCNVGVDIKAKQLIKDYDAVVLCCGASNPRDIKVPGRDAKGIYFAVDFLRANTKSLLDSDLTDGKNISAKGKNVIIIGGGDTGNDCLGTSIRHGAKSVMQLEMMPEPPAERAESNPWPQWPKVLKTDYGQEEAIAVFGKDPRVYTTTVKEFIKDDKGNLKQAVLVKLESKKDEKTGRMMMVNVPGSEYVVDCDLVLIAAGFLGSQDYVTKDFKVALNPRTNVKTEEGKYKTNIDKVYTAGDMHRGQSLVVWGLREGRDCAKEIDMDLMGYTNLQ